MEVECQEKCALNRNSEEETKLYIQHSIFFLYFPMKYKTFIPQSRASAAVCLTNTRKTVDNQHEHKRNCQRLRLKFFNQNSPSPQNDTERELERADRQQTVEEFSEVNHSRPPTKVIMQSPDGLGLLGKQEAQRQQLH